MTCPNCQAKTGPNDNFCLRCGTILHPAPTDRAPGDPPTSDRPGYIYPGYGGDAPIAGAEIGPPSVAPPAEPAAAPRLILPGSAPGSTMPIGSITPYSGPAIFPAAPTRSNHMVGVVAVAGAAVLLLLAVFAVTWVYTAQSTARTSGTQRTGNTPTSTQARDVIAAIEANNNAQIAALKTLDSSQLDGKMAGPALADNQQMVQTLQQRGLYQDAHLISIDYGPVQFQDANTATVNTVEQWESTVYDRSSGQVAGREPAQTLHETYTLVRQNGDWIVQQVVILEDQGTPAPDQ